MNKGVNASNDIAGFKTLQSISSAKKFNTWTYETIKPYLKGRILELGSGIGNITDQIAADFTEIVISDYSEDYCAILKDKYRGEKNILEILNIDLQNPNFLQTYQHLQSRFDTIILLNVIEHLADDEKCVAYCRFLLQPGGHFIVLAPAFPFLYSAFDKEIGHYRRYSQKGLATLLEKNGFAILKRQYFNVMGIGGWLLFNKFLGRKTITEGSMKNFDRLMRFAKLTDKLLGNWLGLSTIVVGKK